MTPEILAKLYAETMVTHELGVTAFHHGPHMIYWSPEGGEKCANALIKGPESMEVTSFNTLEEAAEFLFVGVVRVRML